MPRGPPVRFLRSGHLYLWADAVYTCRLGSKRPLNACLCAEGKKEKERAYLKANNCVLLRTAPTLRALTLAERGIWVSEASHKNAR